jgi:putative FmdB family regulatory protein
VPLYEYQCPDCGRFERIQKFSDATLIECPTCGQAVQRLPSAPAIQFKGTGWYITDYARKGGNGKGDSAKADAAKAGDGAKSDSGSSSKTEGGSPSKSSSPASSGSDSSK